MRIMLDTNVLVSMALFPTPRFIRIWYSATSENTLVIPTYVIDELLDVVKRKFPSRINGVRCFLEKLEFEEVGTPLHIPEGICQIRDPKDYPILYAATHNNIDVFITGDKDFDNLSLESPEILTPNEFLEKHAS